MAGHSSGVNLYYVGGRGPDGKATADVSATVIMNSNFAGGWVAGPSLPAPRANAVIVSLSGTPYVIGGRDNTGAPTTTVYRGKIKDGALTGWEEATDIALPAPVADAAGIATTKGMWIFGGRTTGEAIQATVYESTLGTGAGAKPGAWASVAQLPLPQPRADETAVAVGNFDVCHRRQWHGRAVQLRLFPAVGHRRQPQDEHRRCSHRLGHLGRDW